MRDGIRKNSLASYVVLPEFAKVQYFRELATQKSRKVQFNKQRDCFDMSCGPALAQLALPKESGIYFAPLQKMEIIYSNLLKVRSLAPKIYIAETDFRDRKEVWARLNSMRVKAGPEWILTNRRILTFYNLNDYPFNAICDLGTCEEFETSEWADTDDVDKKHEFVQLLNMCLNERTRLLGLRLEKEHGYYYFSAMPRLNVRKIEYQSIKQKASREVFKAYRNKRDPRQRAYCRHFAFKGAFQLLAGEWYLEITPTYHFTSDGHKQDRFHEERLKGIKRLERNPAVIGHLLMWADYLRKPIGTMFSTEYTFLSFGELATAHINAGIPDDIWYQAEESGDAELMSASENQLTLLGL